MRFSSRSLQIFRPAAVLPVLAWLLVLAFTAWVAAGWFWRLSAPPRQVALPSIQTQPAAVAREITSRNLFGVTGTGSAGQPVVSNSRYKLIGVAANTGTAPGFAILQVEGQPSIAAIEGQEFEPGVKLVRVLARSVEIERGGVRETISLQDQPLSLTERVPVPAATGAPIVPPPQNPAQIQDQAPPQAPAATPVMPPVAPPPEQRESTQD